MAGFSRSAFTVAAAGLLLGSPGLVGAASADDCERSARTQATVSEQSQAAQQVLADLGWQVHDIDEDDDGEVSIEARQGGQEV
ncbi:MAG TPA: PepSY domain-containing protein, partial [Kofleriaceae bacterium]|nr:PepSY domain-containing protein [Kofleriaceae bacterium]